MSNTIIKIDSLTKKFRQFNSPLWGAVGALGLLVPKTKFNDFLALNDINLEINSGERVALIGRNGAGKSTLLRLISGQMTPTSGSLTVSGEVQALLELGTGFHPEFTGIENIKSAMAYRGLSGNAIKEIIQEIEDFTELGDFIKRPVREYSAGMYARLAFAVATSIAPKILIVDEILGAGDAYFVGKCIQRMKNLTSDGATVLFVSHDISSAQMLCDRAIWIDKGNIVKDGPILSVGKAYLASVRADEEARLKAQSMKLNRKFVKNADDQQKPYLLRFSCINNPAPQKPLKLLSVKTGINEQLIGELAPPSETSNSCTIIYDESNLNWKKLSDNNNLSAWSFGDFGGQYLHAPMYVQWPNTNSSDTKWIEVECIPSETDDISFDWFDEDANQYKKLEVIKACPQRKIIAFRAVLNKDKSEETHFEQNAINTEDRYGTGDIEITNFEVFDSHGEKRHTLFSGDQAKMIISYQAKKRKTNPVFVIAIYKPDGSCVMQLLSNRNGRGVGNIEDNGKIVFDLKPLLLGAGDYLVSVAIFHELNLYNKAEPKAYDLHDRSYALKVYPPDDIKVDLGVVNQPINWELS